MSTGIDTERPYHFTHLLQVSKMKKKKVFTNLFQASWGIQPPGDKVLMSKEISCHFGNLLPVSNHRRQQVSEKSIILPFSHTKAQGTKFDIAVK